MLRAVVRVVKDFSSSARLHARETQIVAPSGCKTDARCVQSVLSSGRRLTMKKLTLLLLLTVFASPAVLGQSHTPGDGGPDPANIASRTAPVAPPAGVPMLTFHFGARPVAPLGQKFGNVAAVAFTREGHLLVFNRNPQIEMVEYDATGTRVLRVFNPNIAINPHALRVDRHGSIWVSDSYWNVVWKLSPK